MYTRENEQVQVRGLPVALPTTRPAGPVVGAGWRMRTAAWVLRPSGAASSGAQSLFPSRGKASGRARLDKRPVSSRFPAFLSPRRVILAPKIVSPPSNVQSARVIHVISRRTQRWNLL